MARAELEAALWLASAVELAFVADAAGTGTKLINALAPERRRPAVGEGSRAAHGVAGYVELYIDIWADWADWSGSRDAAPPEGLRATAQVD
ncbi:hypothetical protein SAMN05444745_1481 [Arthrobacter sp. OV608]|nr:hypothetical protein SAMN05444745_1481 [Arthrobacter sp. OV608]